jgi:hypothetical protein
MGNPTQGRTVFVPADQWVVSRELMRLAIEVALEAPLRPSRGFAARIPWDTIEALRAELERHGIDWKNNHREKRKKEATRKK